MKGYKGMKKDMTCRGMKYEIGKTYHKYGNISICKNGLHFCERLRDVLKFYANNGSNRYFEVEADGEIKTDGMKYVTSSLTIIREINTIELNRTIYDQGYEYSRYGDGSEYGYGIYGNGYSYGTFNGNGYGDGYSYGDGDGNGNGCSNCYSDESGDEYSNGNRDYIKDVIKYI